MTDKEHNQRISILKARTSKMRLAVATEDFNKTYKKIQENKKQKIDMQKRISPGQCMNCGEDANWHKPLSEDNPSGSISYDSHEYIPKKSKSA